MGLDPLPPSTCVHLSLTPLRVDVINGWSLITLPTSLSAQWSTKTSIVQPVGRAVPTANLTPSYRYLGLDRIVYHRLKLFIAQLHRNIDSIRKWTCPHSEYLCWLYAVGRPISFSGCN